MSDVHVPEFKVVKQHGVTITDDGHIIMRSGEGSESAMNAECERLRRLHANGRVAMARCPNGPCDYPRISDPSGYVDEPTRERLVLCSAHKAQLA